MTEKKLYILDTSVLLYNSRALHEFERARIGIPLVVLEELDHIKEEQSFRGHNARDVIRTLDALRAQGHLATGVDIENDVTIQIITPETNLSSVPMDWLVHPEAVDNAIISLAHQLQKTLDVTLVTRDINMRVKADVLGIHAIDFSVDTITEESMYKGYTVLTVPAVQLKRDIPEDLVARHIERPFIVNEFIVVQSNNNPYNMRLFRYIGGNQFHAVGTPELKWSIQPRNIQQRMTLDLLFDNTVQLVSLIGPAGTGKTFLALVAALHEVLFFETYERILITRPVIPLGRDIGYLPGAVGEKLHSWMQPIYDNMDYLSHTALAARRAMGIFDEEEYENGKGSKHKKHKGHRQGGGMFMLDDLIRVGKVRLEAITYMRGRSIPYQFIIIY